MQKMCCSNVVSFDILLLLVSILIFAKPVVKSVPILCNHTKLWKLGGRNIVTDSKGFVLLVVLMPLQCEHCRKQLMKFQTVMETVPEIRIVVVAPLDEDPRLIERYREEFSRVAIGMESLNERIWNTLSGVAHDHFIYDRCGRLASIIRHPQSDTSKFEHTLWALKLAINYAQCGWCQYDPPDLPAPQKPIVTSYASSTYIGKTKRPRIKAVVQPQNSRTYTVNSDRRFDISMRTDMVAPVRNGHIRTSDDYVSPPLNVTPSPTTIENNQKMVVTSSKSQQQQQVSVHKQEPAQQQMQQKHLKFENVQRRVITRPDNNISTASNWRASSEWTLSRTFPSRTDQDGSQQREHQRKNELQHQQEQNRRKQKQEYKTLEKLHVRQEQQRVKQKEQERIRKQKQEQRRIQEQRPLLEMQRQHEEQQHQEQQGFQKQKLERIDEQLKLQEQKTELHTDVSGKEHERRLDSWRQLKAPQHQQNIQDSAITIFDSIDPVKKTSSLYDVGDEEGDYDYSQAVSETTVAPTDETQIMGTKRPFLFEHQVPCAAFTDEICIEQKKRIGADKMSKCCNKGIYLTDLCVPRRCTNATIELCCMQKFLQSKYRCCLNDSKAINSPGDTFSRCCFHKFVQKDDKCCPAHRAKFHWLTAHEICLPNVRVDLSSLRFSIHVAKNAGMNNNNQELNDVIIIDLNEDKSWDHSCEQGAKVLQFPYLPNDEDNSAEKEIYDNSEESK
ncbi:unnamed protein product [Cercopithifilaria johnstoni]|uniref:Selenoprotein P N-terminal domain-containing protein n=1 Tax=Cercopithifilaria johnstoni TaxID=2874296 RepID=A0A8J2LX89_9BILA|nr:unnamed protein product [Cercopithifilaria johnstoni]